MFITQTHVHSSARIGYHPNREKFLQRCEESFWIIQAVAPPRSSLAAPSVASSCDRDSERNARVLRERHAVENNFAPSPRQHVLKRPRSRVTLRIRQWTTGKFVARAE